MFVTGGNSGRVELVCDFSNEGSISKPTDFWGGKLRSDDLTPGIPRVCVYCQKFYNVIREKGDNYASNSDLSWWNKITNIS